jgi:hypothetical protein
MASPMMINIEASGSRPMVKTEHLGALICTCGVSDRLAPAPKMRPADIGGHGQRIGQSAQINPITTAPTKTMTAAVLTNASRW